MHAVYAYLHVHVPIREKILGPPRPDVITPACPLTPCADDSGVLAGGVGGGVALLVMLAIVLGCLLRRRRARGKAAADTLTHGASHPVVDVSVKRV